MKTAADGRRPATLDHAGIAARIPHAGNMCLLDAMLEWSATQIRCSASSHRDSDNPLRVPPGPGGVLHAAAAIEYAAQAMALHGALNAADLCGSASKLSGVGPEGSPAADSSTSAAKRSGTHFGSRPAAHDAPPQAGFLAAVRQVRCGVARLDDVPGTLLVAAELRAGDATQASYDFTLHDDRGRLLVGGRATVILEASPRATGPLPERIPERFGAKPIK